MERLLQKEYYSLEGRDQIAPIPFGRMDLSMRMKTNKKWARIKEVSDPTSIEPSSPSTFKIVANMTILSFECFPVLMTVNIDNNIIQRYLEDLLDAEAYLLAFKVIQLYPDRIGYDILSKVVSLKLVSLLCDLKMSFLIYFMPNCRLNKVSGKWVGSLSRTFFA